MKQFTHTIINLYGKAGAAWLAELATTVATLAQHWALNHITPVPKLSYNYVAKATANTAQPVILKIYYDKNAMADEIQALNYFNGMGCIQLIDHHPQYQALLLQQAVPGTTLTAFYPDHLEFVMDCYLDTVKRLHAKRLPAQHNYRQISDWLHAIDQLPPNHPCPAALREHAIALKNTLLATITDEIFLHGDLHHDNILVTGKQWLAIDPKGVVGDAEFEMAAFYLMYVADLAKHSHVKTMFAASTRLLAEKAELNVQRLRDWVVVRLLLMAAWQLEDNSDPSWALKLAAQLI